jgi:hypothetical protein
MNESEKLIMNIKSSSAVGSGTINNRIMKITKIATMLFAARAILPMSVSLLKRVFPAVSRTV